MSDFLESKDGFFSNSEPFVVPSKEVVEWTNQYTEAFRSERENVILPPKRHVGFSGFNMFVVRTSDANPKPERFRGKLPNETFPVSQSPNEYEMWGV